MKCLSKTKILKRPNKYSTELYVNVIDRETIRVQFRNLSLWFNDADFIEFVDFLEDAKSELKNLRISELSVLRIETIPLSEIDYCDEGHGETPDKKHRIGIDKIKTLIKSGKRITPMLVRETPNSKKKYKRLDGYKRYKAFEELGMRMIECYVDNNAPFGGQTGMPWVFYE